jgi:hypothetical protein
MIDFKTTTVKLPSQTLIKIKSLAVEKGTTQNNIINDLLNKALNETETKEKIKARKINHEMPFYDPKRKGNLANIIGTGEVDKDIDVDKVLDNIHYKDESYK